mmetsp:Transcript_4858/g.9046  ORF Transcript_4858/g.9046 Transcript_4858/m.9046 type:complete len:184 (+) Transcript_4858:1-552(+)
MPYHARGQLPQMAGMHMAAPQYGVYGGNHASMEDFARMTPQEARGTHATHDASLARSEAVDEESRESEVEYVLAKQYKALRTGERLGFPAYSANREILGFYREGSGKVGVGQFIPIAMHRNEFGPLEILQATEILEDAIAKKSGAVHSLKDWGTITNLLDHALVYDWSKDIGGGKGPSSAAPT